MKQVFTFFSVILMASFAQGQLAQPSSTTYGDAPDYGAASRAAGDSCGTYYNDYIGLAKTSLLFVEPMRIGAASPDDGFYSGRGQRFTAPQPIEVSGVRFYAYHEEMTDQMVITRLWDYDSVDDTVGTLLATDTVFVTHTVYTAILPDVEVNSVFDVPVTVTDTYVITIETPFDSTLFIYTNDYSGDGGGDLAAYAFYNNPTPGYEPYIGWYNSAAIFVGWDGDYLLSPRIKFDAHDEFLLADDTICPDVFNTDLVTYTQKSIFSSEEYNADYADPVDDITILWGDATQASGVTIAGHTYSPAGSYDINLIDTLWAHSITSPHCIVDVSKTVIALDLPIPSFTSGGSGFTINFTNTSTNSDSVWWDFGDMTAGTDEDDPSHTFDTLGNYDVWLHAYNECSEDSIMITINVNDVGINEQLVDIDLYPNPANQTLVIDGAPVGGTIELRNMIGQLILRTTANELQEKIDVSQLSEGAYFIKVSNNQSQLTKKIIVKH